MPSIGRIPIPGNEPAGVFPFTSDRGFGVRIEPRVAVHQFLVETSAGDRREQRFRLGGGIRTHVVRLNRLCPAQRDALAAFWEDRKGGYQPFTYQAPNAAGSGTTPVTVRFANEPLSLEWLSDAVVSTGLLLLEVPSTVPSYPIAATVERFPAEALEAALGDQVQELIPLVKLRVMESAVPDIYLSNRAVTVGGIDYEPRLLAWSGISQSLGNESDEATFQFGNADRVMTRLAEDTKLTRARVSFSLFHVGSGTLIHLWAGEIAEATYDKTGVFQVRCADPIYELTLPYPVRRVSRSSCWKVFNDGRNCPYATAGAGGNAGYCDKSFSGPDGCQAHGMADYFGGHPANPVAANIKDNGTGTFGIGRISLTATSIVNNSHFGQAVPEVYTDVDLETRALIVSGREESDFYAAVGIVSDGPIGAYSRDSGDLPKHTLDGQWNHGRESYVSNPGKYAQRFYGLRESLGATPNPDPFDIQNTTGPAPAARAAGTAFLEIRRSDPKGIQLTRPADHEMKAWVSQGMSGWTWPTAATPTWSVLTNPIWICVNAVLRARGYRFGSGAAAGDVQAAAESLIDLPAAITAAAVCETSVAALVGEGSERQFRFVGTLAEEKTLKDWLREILNNCLGDYTFVNGRIRFLVRNHSIVANAFTTGNIIKDSLQVASRKATFNHITIQFANKDLLWQGDTVAVYDLEHAVEEGGATAPLFLKATLNLAGTCTRSQALRIGATRLREELGGITAAERRRALTVRFRTTALALSTEVGQIISITDSDLPGGAAELRIRRWTLNDDLSIEIEADSTTNSMYDLTAGTVGVDVQPGEVPGQPVINPVPGDVLPIGGEAFEISDPLLVEDSQGVKRYQVDITYNPPAGLGVFDGITVYMERSGQILPLGDYRYNGDGTEGTPGRYGTARVLLDPPAAGGDESVFLYALAKSATYRLPLVPRTEAAPSPWREVVLAPVDPIAAGPAAGDVTITAISYQYVDAQTIRVRIDYAEPDPVGTFLGVRCYEEPVDQSAALELPLDGTATLDGSRNLGGEWAPVDRGRFMASPVIVLVPAVTESTVKRFYLASFSGGGERPLVRATEPDATPSITITVEPVAYQLGEEYARLVRNVAVEVEIDDSQVDGPKYRLLFSWELPTDPPAAWQQRLGGVQIVYEYVDGRRANGPAFSVNEVSARGGWYSLYVGRSEIRCWFVSFDNSATPRVNTIVDGLTPQATAAFEWPLPDRPPEAKYADNVAAFAVSNARYEVNGRGQRTLRIDWSWTRPATETARARWGGATIYLYLPGGIPAIQCSAAEKGEAGTLEFANFPATTQTWTFRAISQDNNGNRNTDPADPIAGTPTAQIEVAPPALGGAGQEYTALVTGAAFAVETIAASDGTSQQKISGTFTPPADVTWGGVELRVYDGATLVAAARKATSPVSVLVPNPDSSRTYTVKLVSVDVNGQANSEQPGTPQGTVLVGSALGTLDLRKFLGSSVQDITIGPSGKIEVAALAITATKIADNSISTPKLQANAITANEIAAGAVAAGKIAANAIAALNIQAGVITSDKLDATAINVGGGAGKPGAFRIFNAGGLQIGFIGVESGFSGGWFQELRVGGSSPSTARLVADSAGNLSISGATFSLALNSAITEISNLSAGGYTAGVRVKDPLEATAFHVAKNRVFGYNSSGNVLAEVGTYLGFGYITANTSFGSPGVALTAGQSGLAANVAVFDSGSGAEYRIGSTAVVRARRTGWAAATGTATRSSFATSTVTISQLAERVKALLDDLIAHGLIGA